MKLFSIKIFKEIPYYLELPLLINQVFISIKDIKETVYYF